MGVICLDTNVIVDVLRDRDRQVIGRWAEALIAGTPMVVSLMTFHELAFGAFASGDPERHRAAVREALRAVSVERFTEPDMEAAAALRAGLKRQGRPLGPYDLLIAGQCLARGWTLVTSNIREFQRIEGLNVIDWRGQPD